MAAMTEAQIETLEYVLERIEQGTAEVLSPWEHSFMKDQRERYYKFKDDTYFSPRQWKVVERIEQALVSGRDR